jgi:hypothetical protein
MANFSLRYYKQGMIIPIVGIATLLTSFISHFVNSKWGIALSAFALAGGIFTVIDAWLWCIWPIKYLYQLKDFRGTYNGVLMYERRDEDGKLVTGTLQHKKILTQNGSGVAIRSITYKPDGTVSSESISDIEHIAVEKDGSFKLIYTYLNIGNIGSGFPPHYGTEVLTFSESNGMRELSGHYYTNRLPTQTRGEINVKSEKNKL